MFIQLMLPEMTLRSSRSTPSCWSKAARILAVAGPISECMQRLYAITALKLGMMVHGAVEVERLIR
jgi:hypothetical protein